MQNRKIIVLDDDPTGVQTVHDVSVYTDWEPDSIRAGFQEKNNMFFILTNSRSFTKEETARVHRTIAQNINLVAKETNQKYILISRGDSTLRGHYPLETETLRKYLDADFDGEVIIPFFPEGGRFTLDNIHYVKEGDKLTPVGETEFARDKTFGFQSSHLGDWVEEKTNGEYTKDSCTYIPIHAGVDEITEKLTAVKHFNKVIVNAGSYADLELFTKALIKALDQGKNFLFRTAAAFPKVIGEISDRPLLTRTELVPSDNRNGGFIIIGSHVNKTTKQLEELKKLNDTISFIEFNQHLVLVENGLENEVLRVRELAEKAIRSGRTTVVYTKRERLDLPGGDKEAQLVIATKISDALTETVKKLAVRPSFIIAKGGITSSDIGTKALGVRKALVMGQIKPGIPVWKTGAESKFPDMPYIIFPGNVGEASTLREIAEELIHADQ